MRDIGEAGSGRVDEATEGINGRDEAKFRI